MAALTFLDTNVIAYAFDPSQGIKHRRAVEVLSEARSVAISTQVLLELFNVLTRKAGVSRENALAAVEQLSKLEVVPTTSALVRDAIRLSIAAGISHWDAMIVQAAVAAGCDQILTEDLGHDSVIAGVRIVNPF